MKENQAVARTLEDKNQKIRCVPTNVKVTQSINERISLGNYEKIVLHSTLSLTNREVNSGGHSKYG